MPYVTRPMIQYMHTHGMTNNEPHYSSSSDTKSLVAVSSAGSFSTRSSTFSAIPKKKRLRELPSSVDPMATSVPGSHHHSPERIKSASAATATKAVTKSSTTVLTKSSSSLSPSSKPISSHYSSHKSSNSSTKSKADGIIRSSSIKSSTSSAAKPHPKSSTRKSPIKSTKSERSVSASSLCTNKSQPNKSQGSNCVVSIYHESANANSAYKTMHSKTTLKPVVVPGFENDHWTFDQAKVKFIQGVLQSNVQQFRNTAPFESIDENGKAFTSYTIYKSKSVSKPHSCQALYEASYKNSKETRLVCKVYVELHLMHINYFKMLRFFGKKYPTIVMTWEVFACDNKSFYVFQELAPHGNALTYMKVNGTLPEAMARRCGKQMRLAMDFMGDMGVCHRAIAPRHLLVFTTGELFSIKLTGFRSALVYFNDKRNDIHYQPCVPLSRRSKEADFQAPEIYGDPAEEEFDPVSADVFSYGATLYYLLSGKYPYEYGNEKVDIENEIQQNVLKLKVTTACHSVLGNTLTTVSIQRSSVDKLKNHPWLVEQMAGSHSPTHHQP